MILPIITAISREVFAQTPRLHEEAALALGATRWEMIRLRVFPYARSGMVSAVMLGLGRALGETMAVAMVLSRLAGRHANLISNTNPATIASNIALELRGGHAGQASRADRDRPGAVRGHLRGQLRRPLDRRPQRAEDEPMTSTDLAVQDVSASLSAGPPPAAALGAGAGGGAGRRRGRPARAAPGLGPRRRGWSLAAVLFLVVLPLWSLAVENRRAAVDRLMTSLVWTAFGVALLPLVWLIWTVVSNGLPGDQRASSSPTRCAT